MRKGRTYTARLKRSDRPFLEAEAYRMTREGFAAEGRLKPPSMGEVVSELFAELRHLREEVDELRKLREELTGLREQAEQTEGSDEREADEPA